jgi:hypothetical protein
MSGRIGDGAADKKATPGGCQASEGLTAPIRGKRKVRLRMSLSVPARKRESKDQNHWAGA